MKKDKTCYSVYVLVDPRNTLPFYIGCTNDPETRYGQHLRDTENACKQEKIYAILSCGLYPEMIILESGTNRKKMLQQERAWITYYLQQGRDLTNSHHYKVPLPDTWVDVREATKIVGMTRQKTQFLLLTYEFSLHTYVHKNKTYYDRNELTMLLTWKDQWLQEERLFETDDAC